MINTIQFSEVKTLEWNQSNDECFDIVTRG